MLKKRQIAMSMLTTKEIQYLVKEFSRWKHPRVSLRTGNEFTLRLGDQTERDIQSIILLFERFLAVPTPSWLIDFENRDTAIFLRTQIILTIQKILITATCDIDEKILFANNLLISAETFIRKYLALLYESNFHELLIDYKKSRKKMPPLDQMIEWLAKIEKNNPNGILKHDWETINLWCENRKKGDFKKETGWEEYSSFINSIRDCIPGRLDVAHNTEQRSHNLWQIVLALLLSLIDTNRADIERLCPELTESQTTAIQYSDYLNRLINNTLIKRWPGHFEMLEAVEVNAEDKHGYRASRGCIRVVDLLKEEKQMILLGESGAGKTTTLEYLTGQCANNIINHDDDGDMLIPVLIRLGRCSSQSGKSLEDLIDKEIPSFFNNIDKIGANVILFLDGYDEINPDYLKIVVEDIKDISSNYPDIRIIVTSRPRKYKTQLSMPKYTIRPFTDAQILSFLEKHAFEDEQIKRFLLKNYRLRELMRKPFWLTQIMEIASEKKMPNSQGEIISLYVNKILTREWEKHLIGDLATYLHIMNNLISALAYKTKENNEFYFSRHKATQILLDSAITLGTNIDALDKIAELIDLNLLMDADDDEEDDELRFHHATYQDYFAAKAMAPNEKPVSELPDGILLESQWAMSIQIYYALLEDRKKQEFISRIARKNIKLAVDCILSSYTEQIEMKEIVTAAALDNINIAQESNDKENIMYDDSITTLCTFNKWDHLFYILKDAPQYIETPRVTIKNAIEAFITNSKNDTQVEELLKTYLHHFKGQRKKYLEWAIEGIGDRKFNQSDTFLKVFKILLNKNRNDLAIIISFALNLLDEYAKICCKSIRNDENRIFEIDKYLAYGKNATTYYAKKLIGIFNMSDKYPPEQIFRKLLGTGKLHNIRHAFNYIEENKIDIELNVCVKFLLESKTNPAIEKATDLMIKYPSLQFEFSPIKIINIVLKRQEIDFALQLRKKFLLEAEIMEDDIYIDFFNKESPKNKLIDVIRDHFFRSDEMIKLHGGYRGAIKKLMSLIDIRREMEIIQILREIQIPDDGYIEYIQKDLIDAHDYFHAAFWIKGCKLEELFNPIKIAKILKDNNDFGNGVTNFGVNANQN